MSDTPASADTRRELGQYEIRLKGHLEARWAAWFDGLSLTQESDGTTAIRGSVIDQAALHGLLNKVRDLGLPLIAVTQISLQNPKHLKGNKNENDRRKPQPPGGFISEGGREYFHSVGLIHPPNVVSSVTTSMWTFVHLLTIVMAFFGLLGIAGIYARQVEKAG